MNVPMNPAESLLNFIVHHTDLYMRTKRGETPAEADARWRAAFQALSPFLQNLLEKERKEEREACAKLCNDFEDDVAADAIRARS